MNVTGIICCTRQITMPLGKRLAALTATFVLSATAATHAETMSFQQGVSPDASYDMGGTDIRSGDAIANFGRSGLLLAGSAGEGLIRGLLEIDLKALKKAASGKGVKVESASLSLTIASVSGVNTEKPIEIGLFTLPKDFDETSDTWETYGSHSAGVTQVGSVKIDDTNPSVIFGSTPAFVAAVNAALAKSDNTLRLVLRASSEVEDSTEPQFVRFFSDDAISENTPEGAGKPELRPVLIIDYRVGL